MTNRETEAWRAVADEWGHRADVAKARAKGLLVMSLVSFLVAVLLLMTGCGPEWVDREGWVDEGDLSAILPREELDAAYAAARDLAPCRIEPWGGWVTWYQWGDLMCPYPYAANGCFTGSIGSSASIAVVGAPHFQHVCESALPHELGHYVFARCGKRNTEADADAFQAAVCGRMP